MKLDMTGPCSSCPFRSDKLFFLGPERAREIADALLADKTFACHKTVQYDRQEREDGEPEDDRVDRSNPCLVDLDKLWGRDARTAPPDPKEQHCAGAMIILEKLDRPNQWMRIGERLGMYDRRKLDMKAPVFDDFDGFVESMEALEGRGSACRRRATARAAEKVTSRATARRRTATGKGRKRSR